MAPAPNATAEPRALPMHFDLRIEGPAAACGSACRTWVSATGAISADTPRDFEAFARKHDIRGKTIALDSDGGSVLGALALGRAVRGLGMTTTVGKTVELAPDASGHKRARLLPRAYCESMCAFVLLAGVERIVPASARVMVHQIWLGDRRDDPTAANYSAEDLVLVQRDIGRLAQYTVEMGGAIDLLETALRIPPWEPMRLLSREELRGMKIVTVENDDDATPQAVAAASSAAVLASGPRTPINERIWVLAERSGRPVLSRRHPLTVEGDDIGTFELFLACAPEPGQGYAVTYVEQRRARAGAPERLIDVELSLSGKQVPLKVASSQTSATPRALDTVANGFVSADLIGAFADSRSRSLTVETSSGDTVTAIRIGNAGLSQNFSRLAAGCGNQPMARRTDLRREAEAQPR